MATEKQKRAAQIRIADPTKPMGQVMREAGYAGVTSINPGQQLTKKEVWNELMEKYIPDDLLMTKHHELLTVPRKVRKFVKGVLVDEVEEADVNALKAGLDMGYKLKDKYAAVKNELDVRMPKPILDGLTKLDAIPTNDRNEETSEA